jgi:inosine/xanthosine triphosphatase
MKKIIVGSANPVKINATEQAFTQMFPDTTFEVSGVDIESGVSDQPMSEEETLTGATNRAKNCQRHHPQADYWVGIEGGVEISEHGMEAFAWIVVRSKEGMDGRGRTGSFFLPPQIATLVSQGMEMGPADDVVFQVENSKQKNGAVGLLTDNKITRTSYYQEALLLALIPFKNSHLYTVTES